MSKEKKSNHNNEKLLRILGKVASWTMVSRILGFIRDILLARLLGAGMLADAFFVALKLPNFFRRLFAEGTLTVALVPVLTDERKKSEEDARAYLNALAGLLLFTLLLFTIGGILLMPWLLLLFAPGFHDEAERWQQTVHLARWMFPYLACISLTAMSWAVLNCYRKFSVAAATPALLNIALIAAAVGLAPWMENPAEALAIGVVVGGILQLLVQLPALKSIGWSPRLTWNPKHVAIGQTLRLFGPAVVSIAAVQINILVGTILATLQPVGAVSWLYYADRLVQLPLGVFGIAMSTALLPALAKYASNQQFDLARKELANGLAWLSWITLPAVIGLLILAHPLVTTLFAHGAFSASDAAATALALQAYALGLIAFCWARVLSTACYAKKDAKTPMRYAIISVIANIILSLILMQPLGYIGLALATSLAAWLNVAMLWHRLRQQQGKNILARNEQWRILRACLAAVVMGAGLFGLDWLWAFPLQDKGAQVLWLASAVIGGVMVFLSSSLLMGESLRPNRKNTL